MSGASKLAGATTAAPKKSGGGLKKLAPPAGFKGKPKVGTDLLGGATNTSAAASNPNDLLGLGSEQPAESQGGGLDTILGTGAH